MLMRFIPHGLHSSKDFTDIFFFNAFFLTGDRVAQRISCLCVVSQWWTMYLIKGQYTICIRIWFVSQNCKKIWDNLMRWKPTLVAQKNTKCVHTYASIYAKRYCGTYISKLMWSLFNDSSICGQLWQTVFPCCSFLFTYIYNFPMYVQRANIFCRSVYFYDYIILYYIYYTCIGPEYIVMNYMYLLIIQWSLFSSWMRLFCSICTVLYKMLLNYDVHRIIVCCILFITLLSIYVWSLFELLLNFQVFRCIYDTLFNHVRLHLHVCLLWIEKFPIIVNVRHVFIKIMFFI